MTHLVVVAVLASTAGFFAATVVRPTTRSRVYLAAGFCCGVLAGATMRNRRGLRAVGAVLRRRHPLRRALGLRL